MKQLTKAQSVILLIGSCLMVLGAVFYVLGFQTVTPWVFAAGAAAFVSMQARQTYGGRDFMIKRLVRIRTMGEVCFLLSALFMVENSYHFLLPLFLRFSENGYYHYVTYVHNNWVLLLLVAAVIQLYATHRIANELEKEAKKL